MARDRDEVDVLRTRVAHAAALLAAAVTEGFEDFHMGAGDYVVELSTPEGPSTGGGAHALQHLRLVPRREGYSPVLAGLVNGVTCVAEVRTHEHVAMQYELRFDRPLEITHQEYAEFLKQCDGVFNLVRVTIAPVPPTPELVAEMEAKRKATPGRLTTARLVLVALTLATMVAVYMLARS